MQYYKYLENRKIVLIEKDIKMFEKNGAEEEKIQTNNYFLKNDYGNKAN